MVRARSAPLIFNEKHPRVVSTDQGGIACLAHGPGHRTPLLDLARLVLFATHGERLARAATPPSGRGDVC